MKEVWKEICQGIDIRVLLVTLLSIAFIAALASGLICSFSAAKRQQESSIDHPIFKPIQTNFTP